MLKVKARVITSIISLFIIATSFYEVLATEHTKRLNKALAEKEYYSGLYLEWEKYKKDYLSQVESVKQENKAKMVEVENQYNYLLSQQPSLIAQHTKVQQQISTDSGSSGLSNGSKHVAKVSNSGGSTKQTISVSKPVSKPKTSSS